MGILGPWTGRFAAPPGEINPNLSIGPDRIVLQVDKPNQLLVLRTEDGEPIAQSISARATRSNGLRCRSMTIRSCW